MDNEYPPFSITSSPFVDFPSKLAELTVTPEPIKDRRIQAGEWQGKSFVRAGALITWLGEPATPDISKLSNAEILLDMVHDREQPLLISEEDLLRGDKKCPLTFSILLEMSRGDLVSDFYHNGIHDLSLPKPINELYHTIRVALGKFSQTALERFVDEFHEKQWKYFPLPFTHGMRPMPLDKQRILPICQQSRINEKGGSTAELHQIAIPEDFVDVKLRSAIRSSEFYHDDFGKCYQFALKTFDSRCQAMFDAEIHAYYHLRKQTHVIKCFGGFTHFGKGENIRTHSILLEYGECDLGEYFELVDPPALPEDMDGFWAKVFNVVTAVKYIHSYQAPRAGRSENYDGWHGDIKPDNILWIERQMKLADPGFVNFVLANESKQENGIPRKLSGWTSTYGPPEVNEKEFLVEDPWAVDMWSLGCVLSEAATWVVLGNSGRTGYSSLRQEVIKSLKSDKLGDSDCFHNGQHVLPEVTQWHGLLRSMTRPNDKITRQVLDLVDKSLLLEQPSKRVRADVLCQRFTKIKESAERSRLQNSTPAQFRDIISKARAKDLDAYIAVSQILDGLSVEERKNYPAKSAILTHIIRNPEVIGNSRIPMDPTASRYPKLEPVASPPLSTHLQHRYSQSTDTPVPSLHRASTQITIEPTTFSAYYERKKKESKVMDKVTKASKKEKDKVLAGYFDKRDIVFLVDNGRGMEQYWPEVKFTLTELVAKARNLDEDGMDLRFTRSPQTVDNAKKDAVALFEKAMEMKDTQPGPHMITNMAETLGNILWKWLETYRQSFKKDRKMTIIVLTDGRWSNSSDSEEAEYDVDRTIIRWCQEAAQSGVFKPDPLPHERRPVSIQFVSFGRDPMALARLQRLDDRLRTHETEDIVDTEPSYGSIYKMLLGSFNPDFDSWQPAQASTISPQQSVGQFSNPSYTSSQFNSSSSNSGIHRSHGSLQSTNTSGQSLPNRQSVPQMPRSSESTRTSRLSTLDGHNFLHPFR